MNERWQYKLASGLIVHAVTGAVVALGVLFGERFVERCEEHPVSKLPRTALSGFVAWDGYWYNQIAGQGYEYVPGKRSNIGFFPAYPITSGAVAYLTRLPSEAALLLVSNVCLGLAFVVLGQYLAARPMRSPPRQVEWTLASLGAAPWAFYFRMAYSESMFLLLLLLALWGMQQKWNVLAIAGIVGAATATRVMGLALLVPFTLHLWSRTTTSVHFAFNLAGLLPLCVWGIAAFVLFQAVEFGEPLAYFKAQMVWHGTSAHSNSLEGALHLVTLQPLLETYYPSASGTYWGNMPPRDMPLFNMGFINPLVFFGSVILVGVGCKAGWLTKEEIALSATLLFMAYCLQGVHFGMVSTARYASVVFPVYIVAGRLLSRLHIAEAAAIVGLGMVLLACYSALFANWYWFY